MTVKEYNKEFLPKIDAAWYLAKNLELAIDHAEISKEDKANVRYHLAMHACWSEETKETILKALEYYRIHEGIEKLDIKNN